MFVTFSPLFLSSWCARLLIEKESRDTTSKWYGKRRGTKFKNQQNVFSGSRWKEFGTKMENEKQDQKQAWKVHKHCPKEWTSENKATIKRLTHKFMAWRVWNLLFVKMAQQYWKCPLLGTVGTFFFFSAVHLKRFYSVCAFLHRFIECVMFVGNGRDWCRRRLMDLVCIVVGFVVKFKLLMTPSHGGLSELTISDVTSLLDRSRNIREFHFT